MPTPDKQKRGIKLKEEQVKSNAVTGKSWFFGIGINKYDEFPKLYNAVKDVNDIFTLLTGQYDIDQEHTILLIDEKATRENIIDQFDSLSHKVQTNDKLIIYYSGHGHVDERTEISYWIPFDGKKGKTARYIRSSTIRDYVKAIPTLHTLIISDSCFSGALFVRGVQRSTVALEELETRKSRWALCSGRHDEFVYDGEPGTNSPFTASIINILSTNVSPKINVAKLADQVVELTRANYQQLPEGNPLFGVGHEGGQYVFSQPLTEEGAWKATLRSNTKAAFIQFLDQYPDSAHEQQAKEKLALLEEEEAWLTALKEGTIEAYMAYDMAYPNGQYTRVAIRAIAELEEEKEWTNAIERDKISDFRTYLLNYPKGAYVEMAKSRIEILRKEHDEPEVEVEVEEVDQKIERKPVTPKPEETKRKPRSVFSILKKAGIAILSLIGLTTVILFVLDFNFSKNEPLPINENAPQFILNDEAFYKRLEERMVFDNLVEEEEPVNIVKPIIPIMIPVVAGQFNMGYMEERDGERIETALPVRVIKLDQFYMAKTEVTNEAFVLFLNAKGNIKEAGKKHYETVSDGARIKQVGDVFEVEEGFENHPVVSVTWFGARAYARWLSEVTGERYRLPSEAEWEYVARGGNSKEAKEDDQFRFSGSNEIDEVAWYAKNSVYDTHPVGTKQDNQLNILDMTGNVWEWCADDWNDQYDETQTTAAPWKSKDESGRKVIRGGSFNDNDQFCRNAYRKSLDNTDANNQTGFRLVKVPN